MAYTPQTWHDAPATDTPISSERLDVMEAGIADAAADADAAVTALETAVTGSDNGTATSLTLWKGTAAQYAAIGTKDPDTIYAVV